MAKKNFLEETSKQQEVVNDNDQLDDVMTMLDEAIKIPRGKPDVKTPGRLLRWEGTEAAVFVPREKKTTVSRTVIKESKGAMYYKNEGDKTSSYSFHCNIDADCQDPAGEIIARASELLTDEAKSFPKTSAKRYVFHHEGLKIWRDTKEKKLVVYIETDLGNKNSAMVNDLRDKFLEVYKHLF